MTKNKDDNKNKGMVLYDLYPLSLVLIIGVFLVTLFIPFLAISFFYFFVLGGIVNGVLIVDYKITKYIVMNYKNKNYKPLAYLLLSGLFVVFAIIFGLFLSRVEFINNIYLNIANLVNG